MNTKTGGLVKKTDYDTKIAEIEKEITDPAKHLATHEFNKLTGKHFKERLIIN